MMSRETPCGAGGRGHRGSRLAGRDAAPVFEGFGALVHEHREAVGVREATVGGRAEERGLRWIVDHVEDGGRARQDGEVHGHRVLRAEAGARRVDDDGACG